MTIEYGNGGWRRSRGLGVLVFCALWPLGLAAAAPAGVIDDPLFTFEYDPQTVRFDSVQTSELLPTCKRNLASFKPLPATLTLYARYTAPAARIYVAGTADDIGIYVIREGACDSGVAIISLLKLVHNPPEPQDSPVLSDSEINGVFTDALKRYAQAFGGRKLFFAWLDEATDAAVRRCGNRSEALCEPTYHSFTPGMRNALEEFRKE